jgi:hypothetical protein
MLCPRCEKREAFEQYSFGVYAGRLCDECAYDGFTDHCGIGCPMGTQADIDEPIEPDYGYGEEPW